MALGGVDLNLLVVLQALLEERNLTRAGMRVGMPQPAVSHALARLRRHFRDELLVRTGNSHVLTPLARSLLPSVQESMRLIGDAFSVAGEQPRRAGRTFTVVISDYAIMVMGGLLLRRARELAPDVRLDIQPVAMGMPQMARGSVPHDLLIAPAGLWPTGQPEVIFRDRFVCVVDPANPRLRDGRLSLADLQDMPHAVVQFAEPDQDPLGLGLERLGITRKIAIGTTGWLPLLFAVGGTDMVAIAPERLARRVSEAAGVRVVDAPFGELEIAESAWWHPDRAADPALGWLRALLGELTESFATDEARRDTWDAGRPGARRGGESVPARPT